MKHVLVGYNSDTDVLVVSPYLLPLAIVEMLVEFEKDDPHGLDVYRVCDDGGISYFIEPLND